MLIKIIYTNNLLNCRQNEQEKLNKPVMEVWHLECMNICTLN